jgi:PBP1b-binding outer membrane lipoprotein LpoB
MRKKKLFSIVVLLAFCFITCQSAMAGEKTVKLTVPGCK